MDKFGVVTTDEHTKVGGGLPSTCPRCSSGSVSWSGTVPFCRTCGTEPWEPHGSQESSKKVNKERR